MMFNPVFLPNIVLQHVNSPLKMACIFVWNQAHRMGKDWALQHVPAYQSWRTPHMNDVCEWLHRKEKTNLHHTVLCDSLDVRGARMIPTYDTL